MDDVFFQMVIKEEEILGIILDDPNLRVIKCTPQASIKNITGKSVVLDVLCQDENRKYYNIEVRGSKDCY